MLEARTESQKDPDYSLFNNKVRDLGGLFDFRTIGHKKHYSKLEKLIKIIQIDFSENERC